MRNTTKSCCIMFVLDSEMNAWRLFPACILSGKFCNFCVADSQPRSSTAQVDRVNVIRIGPRPSPTGPYLLLYDTETAFDWGCQIRKNERRRKKTTRIRCRTAEAAAGELEMAKLREFRSWLKKKCTDWHSPDHSDKVSSAFGSMSIQWLSTPTSCAIGSVIWPL